MRKDRRSYRGLMSNPAWWVVDQDGRLVASVRASTREEAKGIFRQHNLLKGRVVAAKSERPGT